MSLNSFDVDGRVVNDPELRDGGRSQVLSFRFVHNSPFGEKKASFFTVELWGNRAPTIHSFLKKGQWAVVSGRVEIDSWTNKEGVERTTVKINANDVSLPPRSGESADDTDAF